MPELHFKGKEFVYNHHLTVPYRPLIAQPEKSLGDNLENLIIHGDNLHALKSLLPRYAGKVDCIFIDPPYNTGNENWSYNDNVNNPIMREWLASNPVNKDDMLRHDKWACLMYPRLKFLNELLSEFGTIWMTLDDNEAHRARLILDEVFGEDNFIAQIAWEKVYSPRMDAEGFSKDYDSILVYAKDKEIADLRKVQFTQNASQFTYTDPETGKQARLRTLRKEGSNSLRTDRPNMWYPIKAQDGTEIWPIKPDGTEGCWRWGRAAFEREFNTKPSKVLIQKNERGIWEV
jgi:adenine-specific DNA-methyltransferase